MRFTNSEILEFKRISDENMVFFFREELGAGLFKGLPSGVKKQLKRHEIITRKGHSSKSGLKLSDKGKDILKLTMANNEETPRIEPVEAPQDPPREGVKGKKELEKGGYK